MGTDAFIETNTGKSYSIKNRLLIPLYQYLDSYCQGYEGYENFQPIEAFFDDQACAILGPIINAYYYAPLSDYTEIDFDAYYQAFSPRADGIPVTEADFLEDVRHMNQSWVDISHYLSVMRRLIPAIDQLHKLDEDPVYGEGPALLKEFVDILELALQEGAEKVRLAFI